MAAIELRSITKIFRDGGRGRDVAALEDITLSFASNDFVCLLGPSGCRASILGSDGDPIVVAASVEPRQQFPGRRRHMGGLPILAREGPDRLD
jgi:ABC-type taurine transport system ATPase subunit